MPWKKVPCPQCWRPKSRHAELCRQCKPTYVRSDETRKKLSEALSAKPKPWLVGRQRPDHSRTMKDWWTPERREDKRREMLQRNPEARYHGLSARAAKKLVQEVGQCQRCQHDGSESRLGIHHIDRNKHNQQRANLEVLCHRCHMQEHASTAETGWDSFHRKRRSASYLPQHGRPRAQ